MQLSEKFRIALKSSPVRMYRLAQQVGLHPSTLSKFLNGIAPVKAEDPRLLRLGALLGLGADELFEARRNEGTLSKTSAQHG
jgi:transcriptional regulator with XRE-family HTH domain